MNYLTKQKFDIRELVELPSETKTVLLIVGEEFLRQIYHKHLTEQDFEVITGQWDEHATYSYLNNANLLVIDFAKHEEESKLEFLKTVSKKFPDLGIITVGHALAENTLHRLMDLGVRSHLDRRFSRPADLVSIAKTILRRNI